MGDDLVQIPYAVHEGDMARMERANRRMWILCLVMFLALVATNAGWIWYESQWVEVETTIDANQDTDGGGNNFAIGGDMDYGASACEDNDKTPSP